MGEYIDEVESENEESEEDEDVFDVPIKTVVKVVNNEHSDPNSYSWLVMKLATLKIVQNRINDFLMVVGNIVAVLLGVLIDFYW